MHIDQPVVVSVLFGLLVSITGGSVHAARLLRATVELEDQVILCTVYEDDSNPHPERVWRYLGREPGWAELSKVVAEPEDPLRANLQGDLVIRIGDKNQPLIEAKTSELALIRRHPSSDRWFLPEKDLERVAQANGIPEPSLLALSEGERWRASFWGGAALLAIALILVVLRVRAVRRGRNTLVPAQAVKNT